MNKRIFGLFRNGKSEHINEFVNEGHLYLSPLKTFLEIEDQELRGDPDEDVSHCYQANSIQLSMEINGKYEPLPLIHQVLFRNKEEFNPHVLCLSTVKDPSNIQLLDPKSVRFGGSTAVITQGDKFIERVYSVAKSKQLQIEWSLVDYVDRKTYNGNMGVFRKFTNFSWQNEFRIAIFNECRTKPISLRIGSLKDICVIIPTEEINSRIKISESEI